MPYDQAVRDFQAIRRGEMPGRVPVCACSEEFDVKWHGQYLYEEFCQDGQKMFEVLKATIDRFDYDWAWVQIDDCFEFEPLGVMVRGEGNILRGTVGYLPVGRDCLQRIAQLDPETDGRMPEKLRAIRLLRAEYGDCVLVTGALAAPFSAVGLMWSIEESMVLLMADPVLLHDAMRAWSRFSMRFAKAQRDAGAHAIWLGDCTAISNMVSVEMYEEHILPITRELVRYCENQLDLIVWLHNSEVKTRHVLSHVPLGYSYESIGPEGDIAEIREATRGKVPISGNLDPIEVLWRGTPETIAADVERIMGVCKQGGAYIFNTGEMVPRETPERNMDAMMQAAKRLAVY